LIKGIIFDLGSTLIKFEGDWQAIGREGAEEMATWYLKKKHIKLDAEALVSTFLAEREANLKAVRETHTEILAEQSLKNALAKINAPASAGAFAEAAIKIYFTPEENACHPYPNAIDTLKQLKLQNYRMGLYSNASDDTLIQRLVNKCGLRPWLSPTFSSAGLGKRKPNPYGFNLIAERWELDPDEIVVIGDTLSADILGAQNAGMHSILVTMNQSPSNAENDHIQPEATADDLSELPDIIAKL